MMRSHLQKVFSSDIGVESSYQVLDILEYACGLVLGLALISTKNPNFEMASSVIEGLKNYRVGFIPCNPDPVNMESIIFYDNRIGAAFICSLPNERLVLCRDFIYFNYRLQLVFIVFENFRT